MDTISEIRSEAARLGYKFCIKCGSGMKSDAFIIEGQEAGWCWRCPQCKAGNGWFDSAKEAEEAFLKSSDRMDLVLLAEKAAKLGYTLSEYQTYLSDFRKVVQVKREYAKLPKEDGVLAELWRKADMCRLAHWDELSQKGFLQVLDEQKAVFDKEAKRLRDLGVETISDIPYFNEVFQEE